MTIQQDSSCFTSATAAAVPNRIAAAATAKICFMIFPDSVGSGGRRAVTTLPAGKCNQLFGKRKTDRARGWQVKNFSEIFQRPRGPSGRTLPVNHRAPNHFRFSARIARCIAVIGGTGGCLHGGGWGSRVSVRRAVWRGGLHHRCAGALLAGMGSTLLRSGRSTALRPTGPFPVLTGVQGSAKSTLML